MPFKEGDILNVRDIEQGLENIQRTPWVDVKINIIPGVNNGTSEVEIKPQRTKRWNLRTTYNNFGDKSTGNQLLGTTGYLYNLTKSSDLFIWPVLVVRQAGIKMLAPTIVSLLDTLN